MPEAPPRHRLRRLRKRSRLAIGIYAGALQALGLLKGSSRIADMGNDAVGQALASAELPKREAIPHSNKWAFQQKLAMDQLKVDQFFAGGLLSDDRDQLIVKSTIDLAHGLGLEVIADGIETPRQLALLQRLGCDHAQGFLLGGYLKADHVLTNFPPYARQSVQRQPWVEFYSAH